MNPLDLYLFVFGIITSVLGIGVAIWYKLQLKMFDEPFEFDDESYES